MHVHYWLSGIGLLVFVSGLVVNRFRKNAERKGRVDSGESDSGFGRLD